MNYLTLQDMLWLNLQLTKSEQEFDFALLEEATFLQYAYYNSKDVAAQAAKFLTGFKEKAPFSDGNEACAFIGALAFVEANGKSLSIPVDKGSEWLEGVWADPGIAKNAIKVKLTESSHHEKHGVPNMHEICEGLIEKYAETLDDISSHSSSEDSQSASA